MTAVRTAVAKRHLRLRGLQCHIGSQIFALDGYAAAGTAMIAFMNAIKRHLRVVLAELDMGGKGISYLPDDAPAEVRDLVCTVVQAVQSACLATISRYPNWCLNRAAPLWDRLVGPSTVGARIPGVRTYIAVDGGMSDNPAGFIRVALALRSWQTEPMQPKLSPLPVNAVNRVIS